MLAIEVCRYENIILTILISFVMKHKMPIAIAIAAIAGHMIVFGNLSCKY